MTQHGYKPRTLAQCTCGREFKNYRALRAHMTAQARKGTQ